MRRFGLYLIDLLLVALASALAIAVRDNFEHSPERLIELGPYIGFSVLVAACALPLVGTTRSVWRFSSLSDYLRLGAATVITILGAIILGFSHNRLDGVARSLPILQTVFILFALVGVRVAMRLRHRGRREREASVAADEEVENVLIVGINHLTELYLRSISEFAPGRFRVAGLIGRSERHTGSIILQHKVLGKPDQIDEALRELAIHGVRIDTIVVAMRFEDLPDAARLRLLDIENGSDIRVLLLPEGLGLTAQSRNSLPKARELSEAKNVGGPPPVFSMDREDPSLSQRSYFWNMKRFFDFSVSLILLIVLLPVIFLVAILVSIDVGLPVTFWQQRPGLRGRPFNLYKFRSMAAAHDSRGNRIADEKRVSNFGWFIRRTRLDELPQLYNILVGEMSFVGPRPLLPVDQAPEFAPRLLVRPGLTGWAQVTGGREINAADKAALDIWYVKNASLACDLNILLKTVSMIVAGEKVNTLEIGRAWSELEAAGICTRSTERARAR